MIMQGHSTGGTLKTIDASLTRQHVTLYSKESQQPSPSTSSPFPMSGEEAAAHFHQYLTPFERDEVKEFP